MLISTGKNTFTSLLYKGDYRDYYYKVGGSIGLGLRATENLAIKLAYISQSEKNATNHTKFSIFKYNKPFRINPEIAEGEYRGFKASILYRSFNFDADITAEHTNTKWLQSDFCFSSIRTNIRKQYSIQLSTERSA